MKRTLLFAGFLAGLTLVAANPAVAVFHQDPGPGGGGGGSSCATCVSYLQAPTYKTVWDCEPPPLYEDGYAECHATYTEEDGWDCWVEGLPTCQWT